MSDTGEDGAPRVAKAGRRQGRRASQPTEEEGYGKEAAAPEAGADSFAAPKQDEAPAAAPADDNRNKGWGENVNIEDKKFVGISRRKQQQMEEEAREDKTSGMRNRKKHEEADTEMILDIPELEADGEEDITTQVAEAPRAWNNRMQTMDELDNDQQYNLPSNNDLDIDLSLLTTVLCSAEQVEEDADIWEPEILFTDVASELTLEAEALEEDQTEEVTSP